MITNLHGLSELPDSGSCTPFVWKLLRDADFVGLTGESGNGINFTLSVSLILR
jgi:hypothetical protein